MKFLTLVFWLMSAWTGSSQLSIVWTNTFRSDTNFENPDQLEAAVLDKSNNLYVTGDSFTLKYDGEGKLVWAQPVPGSSIVLLEGGDVVVASIAITRIRANGDIVWRNTNVFGRTILLDSKGLLTVLGVGGFRVFKLSLDGNIIWDRDYGSIAPDGTALAIATGLTGDTFVSGISSWDPRVGRILTLRADDLGHVSWVREFKGGTNSFPGSVSIDSTGTVFVSGEQNLYTESRSSSTLVLKYNASGQESVLIRNSEFESAGAMTLDLMGNVFLETRLSSGNRQCALVKFDSEGHKIWTSLKTSCASFPTLGSRGNFFVPDLGRLTRINLNGTQEQNDVIYAGSSTGPFLQSLRAIVGSGEDVYLIGTLDQITFPNLHSRAYFVARLKIPSSSNLPVVLDPPGDQTVVLGGTVSLNVKAIETEPTPTGLTYQWLFQGTLISGATNGTLVLTNLNNVSSGWYSAIISNSFGVVVTSEAHVIVSMQIENPLLSSTGTFSFSFISESNWVYEVQSSTDLKEWEDVSAVTASNELTSFSAPVSIGEPQRYYRVVRISG